MQSQIDPVCGLEVDETSTHESLKSKYKGTEGEETTYFFCSADCKEEFDAAPEDYIFV